MYVGGSSHNNSGQDKHLLNDFSQTHCQMDYGIAAHLLDYRVKEREFLFVKQGLIKF